MVTFLPVSNFFKILSKTLKVQGRICSKSDVARFVCKLGKILDLEQYQF